MGKTWNRDERDDRRRQVPAVVVCSSGKAGFSYADAMYRLDLYSGDDRRARKPTRIYECQHCGAWHLTSRPLR